MAPKLLKLGDVIKKLQRHGPGFNLYHHRTIKTRWYITLRSSKDDIQEVFSLTAPKGMKTYINQHRLKDIANHFDVPKSIFY
jgi:hypothetical protein